MKDCKRDYLVVWIEDGTRYVRQYYKESDAKNLAFKLIHDVGIYEPDVQVIDNRINA